MLKNFLRAPAACILFALGILLVFPALSVLHAPADTWWQRLLNCFVAIFMLHGIIQVLRNSIAEIRMSKRSAK